LPSHFRRRLLDSPGFLFSTVFVLQVVFWTTFNFQQSSWKRDIQKPLTVTSEWHPNRLYEPSIEAGFTALSTTDPEKVAFLRSRGIPIHILSKQQMALSGCPRTLSDVLATLTQVSM